MSGWETAEKRFSAKAFRKIAIAVRIERTAAMSGAARMMTEEVVMPVLAELGYVPVPE